MRSIHFLTAMGVPWAGSASAQNAPAPAAASPDAAALISKTLDSDRQYEIGTNATRHASGDWSYGFEFDDPGLERSASTKELDKGEALLATAVMYDRRCARADKAVTFTFGGGERFPLKGSVAKGRRADGWLYFGDGSAFEPKPLKLSMALSENDGALYLKLDPARLARSGRLAICATAAPPPGKRCVLFSLAGFARAYDFVCDAK